MGRLVGCPCVDDDGDGGYLAGMSCLTWGLCFGVLWVWGHHAMGRAWGVWLGWIAGHIRGDGPYHEPPLRFIAAPSGAELFRNGPGGSTVWVTECRHTEAPTRVHRWSIRSFWRSQGAGVAHSAIPWVG